MDTYSLWSERVRQEEIRPFKTPGRTNHPYDAQLLLRSRLAFFRGTMKRCKDTNQARSTTRIFANKN